MRRNRRMACAMHVHLSVRIRRPKQACEATNLFCIFASSLRQRVESCRKVLRGAKAYLVASVACICSK